MPIAGPDRVTACRYPASILILGPILCIFPLLAIIKMSITKDYFGADATQADLGLTADTSLAGSWPQTADTQGGTAPGGFCRGWMELLPASPAAY